jgi:aryl sulfotransferase
LTPALAPFPSWAIGAARVLEDDMTALPQRVHSYQTPVYDSDRWDGFTHRAGDILVCTPPKCGTTWTQMICALLVHQTPDLPLPLTKLSRWVERLSEPIEAVNAELGAQPYRRVLKSHTPLDGLPYFEDASYIVCARDPRDAFLSMIDHIGNLSPESIAGAARQMGLPEGAGFPFPTEPNALFAVWLTVGAHPWMQDGLPFGSTSYFATTYWTHRRLPNLYFLHYADLMADLDGEMRRLAAFLGIAVDEAKWPALVAAASFASMKADANRAAPGAHNREWLSNDDFFKRARMGEWRGVLSEESLALYERLSA